MQHEHIDHGNEPIFDMEQLLAEARSRNRQRAHAALFATAELKILVDLRENEDGVTIKEAWSHVFDATIIRAEIAGKECERRRAAVRVLVELDHIHVLRAIARGERPRLSDEETRRWAERVARSVERLTRRVRAEPSRAKASLPGRPAN